MKSNLLGFPGLRVQAREGRSGSILVAGPLPQAAAEAGLQYLAGFGEAARTALQPDGAAVFMAEGLGAEGSGPARVRDSREAADKAESWIGELWDRLFASGGPVIANGGLAVPETAAADLPAALRAGVDDALILRWQPRGLDGRSCLQFATPEDARLQISLAASGRIIVGELPRFFDGRDRNVRRALLRLALIANARSRSLRCAISVLDDAVVLSREIVLSSLRAPSQRDALQAAARSLAASQRSMLRSFEAAARPDIAKLFLSVEGANGGPPKGNPRHEHELGVSHASHCKPAHADR